MNDLLNMIDIINETVDDAELEVLESLGAVYTKSIMILESYDGDASSVFSVFQEGEVLNQAKGNSNESMIKRILLFIPRLIKAIFQKVFGKSQQTDQMANKIMNSNVTPNNDITVELTFGLNENPYEILGINNDNNFKLTEITESLENKTSFGNDDITKVDEAITHFTEILNTIKNKQKVQSTIAKDNVKETVKNISARWNQALAFAKSYIKDMESSLTKATAKLQNQTDETTTRFLGEVQKLVQIVGNVAATFENVYNNEIKPIYANIFGQSDSDTNPGVQQDNFEGGTFNQSRLQAQIRKYKQQNPTEYVIMHDKGNNAISFIIIAGDKSIASMKLSADKVDKSLIPPEGKSIKGSIKQ